MYLLRQTNQVYLFKYLVSWKSHFWHESKTFIGLFTTLWTSTSSSSHYLLQSLELLEANSDVLQI